MYLNYQLDDKVITVVLPRDHARHVMQAFDRVANLDRREAEESSFPAAVRMARAVWGYGLINRNLIREPNAPLVTVQLPAHDTLLWTAYDALADYGFTIPPDYTVEGIPAPMWITEHQSHLDRTVASLRVRLNIQSEVNR